MAIFDYKDYTSDEAARLAKLSFELARATSLPNIGPLSTSKIFGQVINAFGLGAISGSAVDLSLPDGWRALSAAELGLSQDLVDGMGFLKIESPLTGFAESGPQVKIFVHAGANGQIDQMSVSFAATNSPLDVPDYFQLQSGEIAPRMEPILQATRDFAAAHGLSGKDVLVTGYSLGSGMANIMARYADTLADGFFADSDYIAHDGPMMYENTDRILNIGWENDVVYGVIGDKPTLQDAVEAGGPFLVPPDYDLKTSADNMVVFDGAYASPLWPFGPFSLLNIAGGWYGHIAGVISNGIERITQSEFYGLTERDSVVVVSELGADLRGTTWVWDKPAPNHDRPFSPSIVIGTDWGDMLKDSSENDYLEGRSGNDTLRVTDGNNRVSGGEGTDTLRLQGYHSDWKAYRMADGTLFMDKVDGTSLNEATGVEQVEFEGAAIGDLSSINWLYSVQSDRLEDEHWSLFEWGDNDLRYSHAVEGSAGDDVLSGKVVFGRAGADTISGTSGADLLHGGAGDDVITGRTGDRLYGAEGNDRLIAETGGVRMNGGWGADEFVLKAGISGKITIADFDALATGDDHVVLSASQFGTVEQVLSALVQEGDDVVLRASGAELRFSHTDLSHFGADDFLFV